MVFQQYKRWLVLIILLFGLFLADISMGSVKIPLGDVLSILLGQHSENQVWSDIIFDFRMTKALTCVLAGSALSLGGLQMQTLFRNPLAGPDVLGLTSGASLAVSLILMGNAAGLELSILQTPWSIALAASIGCALVFVVMLLVSKKLYDNVSLLIVGLMIGAATSSIVSVLQYFSKAEEMQVYMFWTFGSLGNLNWSEIHVLTLVVGVGFLIAIFNSKSLNAWFLGDRYAQSLGIDIRKSRLKMILSASILTGAVTAFCGPIAFIGLAVPHLVKILIKTSNHLILIPAVIVGGASLVLLCDILAQLPGNAILPINAITALIGAPVVIWVILKIKRVNV
jgi:iron complex transport system permease protein